MTRNHLLMPSSIPMASALRHPETVLTSVTNLSYLYENAVKRAAYIDAFVAWGSGSAPGHDADECIVNAANAAQQAAR